MSVGHHRLTLGGGVTMVPHTHSVIMQRAVSGTFGIIEELPTLEKIEEEEVPLCHVTGLEISGKGK